MRGGMSVPWGDGCSRGMGVPGGGVFQGGWEFQGVGVPLGWVFQGDECSGGWVSRGMGVPDTDHPLTSLPPALPTPLYKE